jgi:uncharacterized membrane protein YciS (DUF1049 family)
MSDRLAGACLVLLGLITLIFVALSLGMTNAQLISLAIAVSQGFFILVGLVLFFVGLAILFGAFS